jgi:hypothetical protein
MTANVSELDARTSAVFRASILLSAVGNNHLIIYKAFI